MARSLEERVGMCARCGNAVDMYSSVHTAAPLCRCPILGKVIWLGYPHESAPAPGNT